MAPKEACLIELGTCCLICHFGHPCLIPTSQNALLNEQLLADGGPFLSHKESHGCVGFTLLEAHAGLAWILQGSSGPCRQGAGARQGTHTQISPMAERVRASEGRRVDEVGEGDQLQQVALTKVSTVTKVTCQPRPQLYCKPDFGALPRLPLAEQPRLLGQVSLFLQLLGIQAPKHNVISTKGFMLEFIGHS